ncbi:histamine H4 receptor-like [Antedon mediterranea]|uniref:histamine H4 receptor-like n=1 Tax=Antedon mediterranea TaxID=105859 RepID=UPI003AF8E311
MESPSDNYVVNETDDTLTVSGGIIICWIMCVVTVFGNSLVILAFITETSLRLKPANLFILNLSLADFFVGAFSFPPFTLLNMFGYWPFGEGVCKMWLIIDYTACGVSVCGIILISLDRYWMLKMKLKYRQFQTTKRVTVMILVSWAILIPFYTLSILFWEKFRGEQTIDYSKEECGKELKESTSYSLVNLFVYFVTPLTIIIYLNSYVFKEIRHRTRTNPIIAFSTQWNVNTEMSSSMRRHRKAAVTLAVLLCAFIICWTPYCTVLFLSSVSDYSPDEIVYAVLLYLVWSNSAINPLIYALTNLKIRNVFFKILRLKCFKWN